MRYWFLLFGLSGLLPGQGAGDLFNRAPAGVEEAARARVTQYFTFQMEGKFRQAEALVCEAGRDAYYDMEKTRWKSFEIVKTSFEDGFRSASNVVLLGTVLNTPQGPLNAKYPYSSTWKLEQGDWCFYIDPVRATTRETPFGKMKAGPESGPDNGGRQVMPSQDQVVSMLKRGVRAFPNRVSLSSFESSSARVEIVNSLDGAVDLEVTFPPRQGLTVELRSSKLAAGESTELHFNYSPRDKSPKPRLQLEIRVSPSGVTIPVVVDFALTPEAIQMLPPELRPKPH